jgi:hypothetical protein
MRRKTIQFKRLRNGVWKTRGQWTPTYVLEQQHGQGIEYQHYMVSANGKLVCAGVTRHEHINRAIARQIFRVWMRWRAEYITNNPGNYPLTTCPIPTTIQIFPISNPEQMECFVV